MPRGVRYTVATILIALLAMPQADARGGGGGGGGGFHGGLHGGFHGGVRVGRSIARPVFVHNPRVGFPGRQPLPVARRFANNNQFAGTTFPWWGGGWPVGDWGGGYAGGGYYGYANPPQALAPQVIVISQDGQGRMTTAEAPADYTYVKGCHAIANGYHCDGPTATP